jgi:YgiT-type zinc finger domain-containing protein
MKSAVDRCFHCGGTDLEEKEVEELLSTDDQTIRCRVAATVCLRCGERYFDLETIRRLEEIRAEELFAES